MKRYITHISQWAALTTLVLERWEKKPKTFAVTLSEPEKTWEQLAYMSAECLPKLTEALYQKGEIERKTPRRAKYWLKRYIGYGEFFEFEGGVVFDADSFRDASVELLTLAIDTAIEQAALRDVTINPPRPNAD